MSSVRERLSGSMAPLGGVFANRELRRVQLAWIATMVGQWAYYVALVVYAYDQGGAAAVGLVGLIRTIPALISAPISSMLADRYPRERVMLVAHISRALVLSVSVFALHADAHPGVIYTAAGLMTLFGTAIKPAQSALLPSLAATPEELAAANVTFRSVESTSVFIGPALGGFLLAIADTEAVFALTAVSSIWAAWLVARVRSEGVAPSRTRRGEPFFTELGAGFRTIASDSALRLITSVTTLQWFTSGVFNVVLVAVALDLLDLGDSGVGILNSALGIGGALGGFLALVLVTRQRLASNLTLGMLVRGVGMAMIGLWPETFAALPFLLFMGVGTTLIDVSGSTMLQRLVRDEVMARVFGALHTLVIAGLGVGTILAPVLIEVAGIRGSLIIIGALLVVVAALSARPLARVHAPAAAPAETLELLRSIPLFAPLPDAELEYLGRKVKTLTVQPGEVVVAQGEPGDRYYLVDDGELEVAVDGRVTGTLGPGEGFGEIALLRDVPRTASVTAKTVVTLTAIERDAFLETVTGHSESVQAAETMIASRLGSATPEAAHL